MDVENDTRHYISLIILYALLAFSFLSPLASNIALPPVTDFYLNTSNVMQSAMALKAGQFPIRTAPGEYNGYGYPKFQFYSPFFYTAAGYILNLLTPNNPFLAIKITIWLGLVFAGIYTYRLTKQITQDNIAAILAGAAYISSPYLLINIIARGAIAEAIGQCIIPIVLFYTFLPYIKDKTSFNNTLINGLMWAVLAMVHLITFVNTSIMVALLVFFTKKEEHIKKLFFTSLAFIFGFTLASWHLMPIIIYQSLLNISNTLINPTTYNHLTLFSRLIAIISTAVISSGGYSRSGFDTILSPPFYPGIGLSILLGVGLCSYLVWINPKKIKVMNENLIRLLLGMFFLAFFLTWTPFDFWKYLPKILVIEQFSYRFLTQVVWIGILLFGIAISILTNKKHPLQTFILGLILICFSSSSWLKAEYGYAVPLAFVSKNTAEINIPGISDAYLIKPTPQIMRQISTDPLVMDHVALGAYCKNLTNKLSCHFITTTKGLFEFPILYYPNLISIKVDDREYSYAPIKYKNYYLTALKLDIGEHNIIIKFTGLLWANWLSLIAWSILIGMGILNLIKILLNLKSYIREPDLV